MSHIVYPLVLLAAIAVFVAVFSRQGARLRRVARERDEIEVEEHRMFDFLHGLGEALQEDSSPAAMHRFIVEGVARVVGADAGVLYLKDFASGDLIPVYLTRANAALVPLPADVVKRSSTRRDAKNLRSFLRLATVKPGEGLVGMAMEEHLPIHAPDLLAHPAFEGDPNPLQQDQAVMVAPLIYGQKEVGVLGVTRRIGDSDREDFSANDFDVFASVAEQSSFALGSAIIHAEAADKRRLEDELHTASEIQRILLPKKAPGLKDYRVAAVYQPARIVSGDYYDYVPIDDDHFGVAIGDVCGKGIPASLIMAMCRSVLRANATETVSAAEVLYAVNRSVFPDIREDMFISLIYLILERNSNHIMLARGGHEPALRFCRETGVVDAFTPPGIAVGIDEGNVFDRVTKDVAIEMKPGDVLLLYTDGVTEAVDRSGNEFGREALHAPLASAAEGGAQAVVDAVYEALVAHVGDQVQNDDITLIAIEKR